MRDIYIHKFYIINDKFKYQTKNENKRASPSPIKTTQQLFFLLLNQLCFALFLRCVIDYEHF